MASLKYKDPDSGQWISISTGSGDGGEPVIIDFPSPLASWVVDIGRLASVVVIDSSGSVCEPGDIHYSGTQITMEFSAPFSGTAYCF